MDQTQAICVLYTYNTYKPSNVLNVKLFLNMYKQYELLTANQQLGKGLKNSRTFHFLNLLFSFSRS